MEAIEREIRAFLKENFLFGESDEDIPSDQSFVDSGLIDSTGVLELVTFVEERYGFQVNDDELVPENLDSIERLARFVEKKTRSADAA